MQKYLYLFGYHPLNLGSFKMTGILQTTQLERNLFKIEHKTTRYSHHRSVLEKYKNNRKCPKGLSLKLNLSLCSNSEYLRRSCRSLLRNASFKLHDNIVSAKRIEDLQIVRNEYFHALKDNARNDAFIDICERRKNENKSLSVSIVQTQNSKYQTDNITIDRADNEWYALKRRGYRK